MTPDAAQQEREHNCAEGDSQAVASAQVPDNPSSDATYAESSVKPTAPPSGGRGRGDNPQTARVLRRQALLLSLGCAAAALPCLLLWNSTRALAGELDMRRIRATRLVADAQAITALRRCPPEVSETGLLRSDLLDRVNRAMQAAGLAPQTLVSTLPQPPRSRPGSDRAEVVNRLLLENISLEGVVRFCHQLTEESPELHIGAIQLRAGTDRKTWNADVSVSYWVLRSDRRG